jgi:DNA-binding MarR family transcriptional regulator
MSSVLTAKQKLESGQAQFGDGDPRIAYSRVFFGLLRVQRSVMPEIEKTLRDLGIRDPIWYEILYAVEQSGEAGVQMLALQDRLAVPQYALSRHVARMEAAGLIRREALSGVGRGQSLHLTEMSQGLQDRVWQVYVERIQAAIAPHMTTDEAYDLVRYLNRLYR